MRNNLRTLRGIACLLVGAFSVVAHGQTEDQKLVTQILEQDRLFWNAYNTCDIEGFRRFLTDDVEFYHDKGGVTLGVDALTDAFKTNLCGTNPRRLRREAVPGSVKVFPLRNGGEIYGAVLSGEHFFYVTEPGKSESRDGLANFTHLWLIKNGVAKMARVLSFDHRAAPPENGRNEIALSHQQLDRFVGAYHAPKTGRLTVLRENDLLILQTDKNRFVLHPETETSFFSKERSLTFQFENSSNSAVKLVVRENDAITEEAVREK